jgi:hypothetical protein
VDDAAYTVNPTRLTWFDSQDVALTDPDDTTRYWLYRALKGSELRSEVYGLDDDEKASVPYSVSVSRYQVRQVQPAASGSAPVVMPSSLEQTHYTYERIATDPQVSQQVALTIDQFGSQLWSVGVNYPRRVQAETSPYPDTLPSTCWDSSYDDQQQVLRLNEQRASVYHLKDSQGWRLGLPNEQRANVLTYEASQVPAGGLNFENLTASGGLLADSATRIYGLSDERNAGFCSPGRPWRNSRTGYRLPCRLRRCSGFRNANDQAADGWLHINADRVGSSRCIRRSGVGDQAWHCHEPRY